MLDFVDMESILKLLLATVLGASLGIEREIHGRPAGLRTNALVCMASALLIVVSRSGALTNLTGEADFQLNVDPARMSAGIVTGIGFLGAGAILKIRGSLVRGLTTAAGIWFVAAIGISVGLGEYVLSTVSTALALLVLVALSKLDRVIGNVTYRTLAIHLPHEHLEAVVTDIESLLDSHKIVAQQTSYAVDKETGQSVAKMALRLTRRSTPEKLIREIITMGHTTKVQFD